jgi:hypothetical protein
MDPPLEAVKIMSGFSEEVATAVIQLEWPASEPLKDSASDMMYRCIEESEQQRLRYRWYIPLFLSPIWVSFIFP